MKYKTLAAAAVAALLAAPVGAAPIELKLSFDGAEVTFFGLDNADTTSKPATGFSFIGFGSYMIDPIDTSETVTNAFSFTGGTLTSVDFTWAGFEPDIGGADYGFLDLTCTSSECFSIELETLVGLATFFANGSFKAEQLPTTTPIPLPAGGVLLLTGLAGFAALKRRKKVAA